MRTTRSRDPWLLQTLTLLSTLLLLSLLVFVRSDSFYFTFFGEPLTVRDEQSGSFLNLVRGRPFSFEGRIFDRASTLTQLAPLIDSTLILISENDYADFQAQYADGQQCAASFLRSATQFVSPVGTPEHFARTAPLKKGQRVRIEGHHVKVKNGEVSGIRIACFSGTTQISIDRLDILD